MYWVHKLPRAEANKKNGVTITWGTNGGFRAATLRCTSSMISDNFKLKDVVACLLSAKVEACSRLCWLGDTQEGEVEVMLSTLDRGPLAVDRNSSGVCCSLLRFAGWLDTCHMKSFAQSPCSEAILYGARGLVCRRPPHPKYGRCKLLDAQPHVIDMLPASAFSGFGHAYPSEALPQQSAAWLSALAIKAPHMPAQDACRRLRRADGSEGGVPGSCSYSRLSVASI